MTLVCLGVIDQTKFAEIPQETALKMMKECFAYDDVVQMPQMTNSNAVLKRKRHNSGSAP